MPTLTPISSEQFSSKTWKKISNCNFASKQSLIHVVAAELPHLVPHMPLGFMQTDSTFELVAICSLQPESNLYVAPDGRWLGGYVPAALRAYPFRLVYVEERKDSILCIDEDSGAVGEIGQGEAFFDGSGTPTQAISNILNLLTQVEGSRQTTKVAVDALSAAGLIQPWPINLQKEEQVVAVEGLFRIDEAAMNALPEDAFLKLRSCGAFAVAYAQLLSMNQLSVLEKLDQMQAQLKEQAAKQIVVPSGLEGFDLFQDDGTITFTY